MLKISNLANLTLSQDVASLLSQHQKDLNSVPIFDQHQNYVIAKHNRVINEYREVYKSIMTPIWNNYGRVMKMGSEILLDENGEKLYSVRIDDQGNEKKDYHKDPTTSVFDNKSKFRVFILSVIFTIHIVPYFKP